MSLPKIVIPLSIQFSVRYLIRTGLINSLREVSEPILLLSWNDVELQDELRSNGYQFYFLPQAKMSPNLERLRKQIQHAHFLRLKSQTTSIDRRRSFLSLPVFVCIRAMAKNFILDFQGTLPASFEKWITQEDVLFEKASNLNEFLELVEKIKPDYLFSITPYLPDEEFLIRAAARKGIHLITSILSFDNITTRSRIPVHFDKYLLWNQNNRQELLRIYPDIDSTKIELVGAPQFDFYYDSSYLWDEPTWRNRLGIPDERSVILFGAGPQTITSVEPHIVAQLDNAIAQGCFPNKPIILLRLHPVDTVARWEALRQSAKHVVFDLPWKFGKDVAGKTNISRYDIEKLVSTLKYCQVHISTSSTMTLDGAIFDRPQIGPAYDDCPRRKYDRAMRELYFREHYLPITQSGGLQIAYSFNQLKAFVLEGFQNPKLHREARKKMIRALCTYDDGKSTQRIVNSIRDYLNQNEHR